MADGYIALVSDMHLAPADSGAARAQSDLDRPLRRARHMEAAIQAINDDPPAAVLFGGDNSNQPADRPAYVDAALTLMNQSATLWKAIVGNHDVGACIGWRFHDAESMEKACAAFRDAYGPDRWTLEAAGFRIIAANSQTFGNNLPEAQEQAEWIADELAVKTDLLRTVFIHTPPYLCSSDDDFEDGSEQMCLRPAARRSLMDILNCTPPALLITGHCHRYWECPQPKWDWLGLPATALGQHEMGAVPSHNLPAGNDAIGWVALRREGASWRAECRKIRQRDNLGDC